MKKEQTTDSTKCDEKEMLKYSGIAIDKADDGKVDSALIKERTKTLNNNPRNDEL